MASTSNVSENIFSINSGAASRFKLKSVGSDDSASSSSSSRLNHSIAYAQLIKAITDGNLSLVKQMVDLGLDVNYIYDDEQNYTFLHLACLMGHSKVIKFLLDSGANPTMVTASGHQPIDLIEIDDPTTISYMLMNMSLRGKH